MEDMISSRSSRSSKLMPTSRSFLRLQRRSRIAPKLQHDIVFVAFVTHNMVVKDGSILMGLGLIVALMMVHHTSSFAPPSAGVRRVGERAFMTSRMFGMPHVTRERTHIFLSSGDESEGSVEEAAAVEEPVAPVAETPPSTTGTEYPIDLPSPILLATSMILAIASTGSVFELVGGNPQFGSEVTAAVAAIGLPSCLFLFYAAIQKGTAETEEDDKVFLNKRS